VLPPSSEPFRMYLYHLCSLFRKKEICLHRFTDNWTTVRLVCCIRQISFFGKGHFRNLFSTLLWRRVAGFCTTVRHLIIALLTKREVASKVVLKCGKLQVMFHNKFLDNSVGIAKNYGMDGWGSNLHRDISSWPGQLIADSAPWVT
jgi:hypothetical protein